jgi:hypothetical protein
VKNDGDSPLSRLVTPNVFCRSCASPLVQAIDWKRDNESSWDVSMWCPECGFEQAATLERSQLLYLSLAIEEGFVWMLEALSELHTISEEPGGLHFAHRVQTDRIPSAGR